MTTNKLACLVGPSMSSKTSNNIYLGSFSVEIQVGDLVRVECKDWSSIQDPDAIKIFVGTVKSKFNALDQDGDNWIYELVGQNSGWFLYKPKIDGGTIEVLK